MRTFSQKPGPTQEVNSADTTKSGRTKIGNSHGVNAILHFQRTLGNQATQRLMRSDVEELQAGLAATASTRLGHDFSRPSIFSSAPVQVQPKLTVSAPGDNYEQEADRAADQVLRMPEPDRPPEPQGRAALHYKADSSGLIQRLAAHESPSLADATVVEEEESEKATVQTLRPQNRESGREEISKQQLNPARGGVPLESDVRLFMEARFDADFSGVQIHADDNAAALSNSLQARAFTYGPHIYFNDREYQPHNQEGKRVLAHELTHVVQQGANQARPSVSQHLTQTQSPDSPTMIQRLSALGAVKRHSVAPWGPGGPTGTDYEVITDSNAKVTAWQAYSPWREQYSYWCHGHSTDSYVTYGYSVYSGPDFARVVADEWTNIAPAQTRAGDIAVWTTNAAHSAKFTDPVIENGQLAPDRSVLSTKNGQEPLARMTLAGLAGIYGSAGIAVFRHK